MKRAILLITLGSAALAVFSARSQIDRVVVKTGRNVPDLLYLLLLLGGVIFTVIGIVIITVVLPLHSMLNVIKTRVKRCWRSPRFACRPANSDELEDLLTFGRSFFGDDIADIDQIKEWHAKNPTLFYLVHKVSKSRGTKTERLVGFFDVIPVTKKAASLLEEEKVNGTTFRPEHIVKPNGSPAAIYVAAVAARGPRAQVWVLSKLEAYVEKSRNKGLHVYTRPVTERGLQLAKQYDFNPVSPGTDDDELLRIYKLNPNAQPRKRRRAARDGIRTRRM